MSKSGPATRPRPCRKPIIARSTTWLSPKYLQYVAPVAVLLILVLSFFAWTGIYPGGVADVTQNAWQATIGWYTVDTDIGDPFSTKKDEALGGFFGGTGEGRPARWASMSSCCSTCCFSS